MGKLTLLLLLLKITVQASYEEKAQMITNLTKPSSKKSFV